MTIWRGKHPLILASQSRARQALLTNAGIAFEAMPADIDERGNPAGFWPCRAGRDRFAAGAAEGAVGIVAPARQDCCRRGSNAGAGNGCFNNPPIVPRPPSNCAHWPATATNCIPPLRLRVMARSCSKPCQRRPHDDAAADRRPKSKPIWMKPARPSRQASAPTSLRGSASICSSTSKAIISPSSDCRCCPCWRSCAANSLLAV